MRAWFFLALFLFPCMAGQGQTATAPQQDLAKDPRAVLAAAAPLYNFNDPSLKPWHLKATYQLYDDKGKPSEQGTFEYWWASPLVYRSTWSRPGATHTDWHTADGRHAYQATGEGLSFYEYKLQAELLSPLPSFGDTNSTGNRLVPKEYNLSGIKLECIMLIPLMPQYGQIQNVPPGIFPTYCFDSSLPVLRVSYSFGIVTMVFENVVKVQGKLLAKEIAIYEGKNQILTSKVNTIEGFSASDPALTPDARATYLGIDKIPLAESVAIGMLIKKVPPVYPQDAKDARVSGKVVLQATIGRDGRVHDLRVEEAPWPSLAISALWAVSQWQYKPYLLNGEPVEIETTINVIFTLGR
jgi:TonB family protein